MFLSLKTTKKQQLADDKPVKIQIQTRNGEVSVPFAGNFQSIWQKVILNNSNH